MSQSITTNTYVKKKKNYCQVASRFETFKYFQCAIHKKDVLVQLLLQENYLCVPIRKGKRTFLLDNFFFSPEKNKTN